MCSSDLYRRAITAAGVSAPMRAHRLDQARRLSARLPGSGTRLALVGCGNGYELPILAEAGFQPEGIEHGGRTAVAPNGFPIHDGYPERGVTLPGAPYGAFACFNFLEHAPDPRGFLSSIAASLGAGGVGIVEVPNYAAQRAAGRVADYVADHLSYFTSDALRAMLTVSGFAVDALDVVRDGENLEAMVTRRVAVPLVDEAAALGRTREAVRRFFADHAGVVVWGASHQALTLLAGFLLRKGFNPKFVAAAPLVPWFAWAMVPLTLTNVLVAQLSARRLRALAMSGEGRLPAMPTVPTFTEAGMKGFGLTSVTGLVTPAKVPRAIINKINTEVNAVLALPATTEFMAKQGAEPFRSTPEQAAAVIREELARYAKIIKTGGIDRKSTRLNSSHT